MPLYTYRCVECEWEKEKFQHNAKNADVVCEECGSDCERAVPLAKNKTWLNSRERMEKVIDPEVERTSKRLNNGSDKDFLDLYGEN